MYGFLITTGEPPVHVPLEDPRHLSAGGTHFYYNPMPKFEDDKLFYQDEEKTVLLDGVIFNKRELMEARGCGSWRETVDELIREDPKTFQKELRGSFCGAVLAQPRSGEPKLTVFTNQSGEKTVYYAQPKNLFAAASHHNILTPYLREQGVPIEPDIQSCRELLATGSILHGKTPFRNLRRLHAGKYVRIQAGQPCEEIRYHLFRNVPEHDLTLEECVEETDKRFRRAVDRIFAKNVEYGYQGECDLSGGLDSRMVTWVAHDLGYRNILNVCYCQSGNIDHTTSRKIAKDLGNEYFFLPMDGGDLLMDVDEVVDKFGGQVTYFICTGANRALRDISRHNVGLCCTGLLGELHNAYWTEGAVHTPPNYIHNRYSSVVPLQIPPEYSADYDNFEHMNLYEYSVVLFMSSALVRQQLCEVTSPFVDVDYLEFAYRVPLKWRKDYQLTKTWMVTKYPQAAKYVWQTKRMPVDKSYRNEVYLPKVMDNIRNFFLRCVNKAARVTGLPVQFTRRQDMNPFEVWYRTNPRLREFFDRYYRENIGRIQDPRLRADVEKTFTQGNGRDKAQAVNLLAVYKRYF